MFYRLGSWGCQGVSGLWVDQIGVSRAVAAEILADEMLEIADGELDDDNPLPEDIARSKLKIETRRFLIGVNNRKRFGYVLPSSFNFLVALT
jgi:hypothetical protein